MNGFESSNDFWVFINPKVWEDHYACIGLSRDTSEEDKSVLLKNTWDDEPDKTQAEVWGSMVIWWQTSDPHEAEKENSGNPLKLTVMMTITEMNNEPPI